jgi:hypothetical protein
MSQTGIPIVASLPQFGAASSDNALAAASPSVQALLASVGGSGGFQNTDSLGAMNPQIGSLLSLLQPPGGLNAQQSSQFGPIFGLLMGLMGAGQPSGGQA